MKYEKRKNLPVAILLVDIVVVIISGTICVHFLAATVVVCPAVGGLPVRFLLCLPLSGAEYKFRSLFQNFLLCKIFLKIIYCFPPLYSYSLLLR